MWEMKCDMAGAAAVCATMLAIAALKPGVAVTAYAPMAENMPSGTSYRPGDVVTMFGGKKVEVLNTDAEGRMILADAIARACEDGCDYLLETSTLTGGQVIALGKRIAGVMVPRTVRAGPGRRRLGRRTGVADAAAGGRARHGLGRRRHHPGQLRHGRAGHMLQGGVFLSEFVADGVAWAHIDIAGPVPLRRPVRLLGQGRHRRTDPDPDRARRDIAANG
jgi:leucyl aminopeptidase